MFSKLFKRCENSNSIQSEIDTQSLGSDDNAFFPGLASRSLSILALADLHYWEPEELKRINNCEFDLCVLLGDIPKPAIELIVALVGDKPIWAVAGNHDSWGMFDGIPVVDLHRRIDTFNKIRFAGFGGSVRYKKGPYAMHTPEECFSLIKDLPTADILLSHDCMYGLFGKEGSHAGLKGITQYITKNRVKLNICGHHHQPCVKQKAGCTTVCVFRCAVITYPEIHVEQIF